jgi:glycosyltransferase involved in cell wall biosynthesis
LYLLGAADRVFVQTEPEYEVLRARGLPADRLVLQGLGVEPGECTGGSRQDARARWGVKPDEVVVGHLANLSVEKGSVDLLRAAESAWQQGRRFTMVLAGPAMPNFRRFWKSYPFAGRVRCLGVLSEAEKRDFFAGIDLFALPSRSDSFGLVLLEAWANGLANLAYRAGGVAGVIRHDEDGLLVRCGDIDGLAQSLGLLINDAELRHRLGSSGQARLGRDYRWEGKLAKVKQAYADAVKGGGTHERAAVCLPNKSEVYSE